MNNLQCYVYVFISMRITHDQRWQQQSSPYRFLEEKCPEYLWWFALLGECIINEITGSACNAEIFIYSCFSNWTVDSIRQSLSLFIKKINNIFFFVNFYSGNCCSQCMIFCTQKWWTIKTLFLFDVLIPWVPLVHVCLSMRKWQTHSPWPYRRRKDQVRYHAIVGLPQMQSKTGFNFFKDQNITIVIKELFQVLKKVVFRRRSFLPFKDHSCNLHGIHFK